MNSGTESNSGIKFIRRLAIFNPRLALIGFPGTGARLLCEIRKRGLEKKYDWLRQEKLREGAAQKKPWTPKPPKKKQTNYCGK